MARRTARSRREMWEIGTTAVTSRESARRVPPLDFVARVDLVRIGTESVGRSFLRLRSILRRISANSRSSSACNGASPSSFSSSLPSDFSCSPRSESSVGGGSGRLSGIATTRDLRRCAVISGENLAGSQQQKMHFLTFPPPLLSLGSTRRSRRTTPLLAARLSSRRRS